jgi:hypothetical protein
MQSHKKTFGIGVIIRGIHIADLGPSSSSSLPSSASTATSPVHPPSNPHTSSSTSHPSGECGASHFVKGNYDMKTFILSHFMLVEYRLRKVLQ